ncbi:UNVERIFIED_CONTAM: protein kinase, putative [Hammondia hammondi]|eukprot:XP_008887599.1 protein kinase, putative [Hammondia hammondi]
MAGDAAAPRSSSGVSRTPLSLRFSLTLLCSLVVLLALSVSLSTPASHSYVFAVVAAESGASSVSGRDRGASNAGLEAPAKSKGRRERSKNSSRKVSPKGDPEESTKQDESTADLDLQKTAKVDRGAKTQSKRDATTRGKKRNKSSRRRGEKSKKSQRQASKTEGGSRVDAESKTKAQVERDATTRGKTGKKSSRKPDEKSRKRGPQAAAKRDPQAAAITDGLLEMEGGSLTERKAVTKGPTEGHADATVGTESPEARVAASVERTNEGNKPAEAVSTVEAPKPAELDGQKSKEMGKERDHRNCQGSESKESHQGSTAPTAGVSAPAGSLPPLSSESQTSAEKEATEGLLTSGSPATSAALASRRSKSDAAKESESAPESTSAVDSEPGVPGREGQAPEASPVPVVVASVMKRRNAGFEALLNLNEADSTSAATKASEVTDDKPETEELNESETQLQELIATVPKLDELLQNVSKRERPSDSEGQRKASNEPARQTDEQRATGPSVDDPMRAPQATDSKSVPTSLADLLFSSVLFPRLSLFASPANGAKEARLSTAELSKEKAAVKSQGESETEKLLRELRDLENGMLPQTVGDMSSTRGETESDRSRTVPESEIQSRGMSGSFSGSGPASSRQMKHRLSIRGSFGEADVVLLHNKPQRGDETTERTISFSATADNSVAEPRRRGFDLAPRSIFGSALSDLEAELQGDVTEFGDASRTEESVGFLGERRGGGDPSRRSREQSSEDRSRRIRNTGGTGHREAASSAAAPASRGPRQVDRRPGGARAEGLRSVENSEKSHKSRGEQPVEKMPGRERNSRATGPRLLRRRSHLDHELEQRRAKQAMEVTKAFDERGGYGSGGHNWLTPGPPLVLSGESLPRRGLLFPEPTFLLEDSRAVQMMQNTAKELAQSRQTSIVSGDRGRVAAVSGAFERLFPRGALFTLQPTHGQPFEPKTLKRGRFLKAGGGKLIFEVWEGSTRWALRLHLTELSERERTGLVSRFPVDRVSGAGVSAWQRTADGVCAEAEELELHAVRILVQQHEQPRDLFCRERIALPVAVGEVSSLPKVMQLRDGEHVTNIAGLYPLAVCDMRELAEEYVMPDEVKLEAVRQMVAAVGRLHSRGVVHLDLKLEHFLLDNHGKVYLGDLSTSEKITGVNVEPTSCEFGSLESLSPEHLACWARQQRKFTPSMATDSWSLGIAIVQLWCGEAPFRVPETLWSKGPVAVAQYLDQLLRRTDGEIDFSGCPGGDISNRELKRIVTGFLAYDRFKRWLPLDVLFTSPLMIDPVLARNAPNPYRSPLTGGVSSQKK